MSARAIPRAIRRIVRGALYVPGYGPHPGNPVLAALLFLGALAGGAWGFVCMLAFFGPVWVVGCWSRGGEGLPK